VINLQQDAITGEVAKMERKMKYAGAEKCSSRVTDKTVKIMDNGFSPPSPRL
jgi:hypothetical protein